MNDPDDAAGRPLTARERITRFLKLSPRRRKPDTLHPARDRHHQPNEFKRLPRRVHPRDTATSHETRPARDPRGGRDTDRDFIIRYGDDGGDG
jgi:hypothetical protein